MRRPFLLSPEYPVAQQQRNDAPIAGHILTEKFGPPSHIRRFSRGDTIWEPGLTAIVGYIVKGTVKLVTCLPDGRTNIVSLIEAPGFFGRVFGVTTEFTIEAATDVVVACFEPAAFEARLSESRELEHFIHMENLYQLDEAHERIIVLACQSIAERMATFMVLRLVAEEVRRGGVRDDIVHVLPNRRDFAAYLGTTVETVSRTIQALVRRGTISIIDSANFRVLRRNDLFRVARQDEHDLVEMIRSRRPHTRDVAEYAQPGGQPVPRHTSHSLQLAAE
ncbi:Crp/Fnr family transcriptional regulator [Devosia sp.]|uniref:Crp/Fnr family transcriptional regulator n=1 Tax=Devosia sp. TaxID=1871048 RepID=UPI002FC761D2